MSIPCWWINTALQLAAKCYANAGYAVMVWCLSVCLPVTSTGATRGAGGTPRNWVHKKIPGCAVELNTQNCAWFGSQISLITAMSFREDVPPANHPPGALPLDPAGGLPSPRPHVPPLPPNPGYATGLVRCLWNSVWTNTSTERTTACYKVSWNSSPLVFTLFKFQMITFNQVCDSLLISYLTLTFNLSTLITVASSVSARLLPSDASFHTLFQRQIRSDKIRMLILSLSNAVITK